MKLCRKCLRTLPATAFYKSAAEVDGLQYHCKECKRAYNKANADQIRARHREYLRRHYKQRPRQPSTGGRPKSTVPVRLRRYGLTEAEFKAMGEAQGGLCAICRLDDERGLVIDHDHDTGLVRGLLCHRCNTGLGLLRDDPEVITRAAGYLRETPRMDGRFAAEIGGGLR